MPRVAYEVEASSAAEEMAILSQQETRGESF